MKTKAKYGTSKDDLRVKCLGLFHDRCYHLFIGHTKDLPIEYNKFYKSNKYVLIYKEE